MLIYSLQEEERKREQDSVALYQEQPNGMEWCRGQRQHHVPTFTLGSYWMDASEQKRLGGRRVTRTDTFLIAASSSVLFNRASFLSLRETLFFLTQEAVIVVYE